jgi:ferredoxin-thioredoxin reductase catalytic subunit
MNGDDVLSEESMLKYIKAIADKKHVVLNNDQKVVSTVVRGLVRNKEKYGKALCPCRVRTGDDEIDRFIECPCSDMEKEVNTNGFCKCRLYFKANP